MINRTKPLLLTSTAIAAILLGGCSSGSGSNSDSDGTVETSAGTYTIDTYGGLGGSDGGSGGNGNPVRLFKESGIGNAEVLASGQADASFTAATPDTNLGDNPLAVTADTTIEVLTAEPASGTPYMVASSSTLRISDGNGTLSDEDPVTGISVASGVTLTFDLNYTSYAYVNLSNDVRNSGGITTADQATTDRGGLRLNMGSFVGVTGSAINTAGTTDGQNGGYVRLIADYSIYNHGGIDSSGFDGTAAGAGQGGYVDLGANYLLQNTADISSHGGNAIAGNGGHGSYIQLDANYGSMSNSGNLNSYGGSGTTSGGNGDGIFFHSNTGDLLNSGDLDTHGGTASAGDGGSGGDVEMQAEPQLASSGDILTAGGDTTDTASNAGSGGSVYFYIQDSSINQATPAGDLLVSGNIDTSGGDAVSTGTGNGGNGGYVSAGVDSYDYPSEGRLAFLGYTDINTGGGDGNFGGRAYGLEILNVYVRSNSGVYIPSGNVVNEANLIATGGNVVATAVVTPATGGNGGDFYLQTDYNYGYLNSDIEKTSNSGNIDISGGNSLESSTTSSGQSGYVELWGYNGVTNTGSITANGGDDLGTDGGVTGYGNDAGGIEIFAELGPVTNSANLTSNGGKGEYRGGRGTHIALYAPMVTNSGNLTSLGGNADATLAASVGGDGGYIDLFTPDGLEGVSHSGNVNNTGGTGEVAGDNGAFVNGGMCVRGDC